MANQQFTDRVTALLETNVAQAIKELSEFLKGKDTDLYHTVLMKSGSFNELEQDRVKGIIDYETFKRERAKIRHALLYVLEKIGELPEYGITAGPGRTPATKSDSYIKGLEQQRELLIKRLNFYRSEVAITNDPGQKFSLTQQIENLEKEIEEIDRKIGV